MEFQWIATALGDIAWISIAFVLGMAARGIGLPPLVGFLVAGFVLNGLGIASGETLTTLSDLGITLLLFTVGLKLDLQMLTRPQVWGVTALHSSLVVAVLSLIFSGLAFTGIALFADMDLPQMLLVAFALSFSSTVFVVKVLEDKGEMASLHGRIAIGILIMQDILAVAFLAISAGKVPSIYAPAIVLLIPARILFHKILNHVGHGELLVLYGFMLAVGGAALFEAVHLKGDLGALMLGVLIANHPKAKEVAKTMLSFKDLFLLGFFLSVGMSGTLGTHTLWAGLLLTPLVLLKSALFFTLLTRFHLRARTSLIASINLSNYSEFGLIVAAIGAASGWLPADWMLSIAIALALSFILAAVLSRFAHPLYTRYRPLWKRLQMEELTFDDRHINAGGATIAVLGMGRVGTGTYDAMCELHKDEPNHKVIGIDINPNTIEHQSAEGRHVIMGDPSDADFWDRLQAHKSIELVMLALPRLNASLAVIDQLKSTGFSGKIAVTAKYPDEVDALYEAGADTVFNIYTEAGSGYASHVLDKELAAPIAEGGV